jgi:hypothetical protein
MMMDSKRQIPWDLVIKNPPINLRIEYEPYPHLRDEEGCVLARDYFNEEKVNFILWAVEKAIKEANAHNPSDSSQ